MSSADFSDPAATWNQRYAADEDYVFGREPNAYLQAQAAHLPPAGTALCVADGEGRNSVWLARQGLQVDAFDVSEVAVAKARRLADQQGVQVHFEVADCDGWPWHADQYDVVAGIFFQFAAPPLRERMFTRMAAALKRGGLLVLQGYTPKQLEYKTGGPGELSHLYTEDLLRDSFGVLQILELRSYEAELHEGRRHVGCSALVGMVARRP